jgi:ABC-2 type transport system ATP-binding protein
VSDAALEIRGLQTSFRRFTLGPLDVTVPRGSIYGLIGPNGAGKTTTLDLIFGMGARQAGSITVFGLDHRRDEVAMKRQVGYVSPDLSFNAWWRVAVAIRFVRQFHPTWDDAYCARLMSAFDLSERQAIPMLSFGARIKLALVLAISWRPRLLVLDEPTVGLDPIAKRFLFAELLEAVRDADRTVLISSHSLTDLERFADHIGMIRKGRMMFEGPTAGLVDRFRMVDVAARTGARAIDQEGVFIQYQDGARSRVLLDRRAVSIERLEAQGARVIGECPVTLEEIFIALGRE